VWMPRCGYAVGANASFAKAHRSNDLAQPCTRGGAIPPRTLSWRGASGAVPVDTAVLRENLNLSF
jgi:hypothetical protein